MKNYESLVDALDDLRKRVTPTLNRSQITCTATTSICD
jgi:hypothetical protein